MARQDVLMEPQPPGSSSSPGKPSQPELPEPSPKIPPSDDAPDEAAVNPDRKSSSSSSSSSRTSSAGCVFHVDAAEMRTPFVVEAPEDDDHSGAGAGARAEAKLPDDWASWPESSPPKTVNGGTVSVAPESQTMAKPAAVAPVVEGFNPNRIPASIFQPKTGSSQQDWSIASNDSLFSIHGASQSQSDDFYAPSRTHFDYFYDEAMADGGGAEPDGRLPPLEEMPGSAMSDASDGSAMANGRALQRHESGSVGGSSNFSFAFPILAEPSPGQKENMGGYQQLQKEQEQSPSQPTPLDRKAAFEEMTTEEERRQSKTGCCCCGECCGCCWFDCSWSTCCCCLQWRWKCCCQWRWKCCECSCCCPSLCRCSWCH